MSFLHPFGGGGGGDQQRVSCYILNEQRIDFSIDLIYQNMILRILIFLKNLNDLWISKNSLLDLVG